MTCFNLTPRSVVLPSLKDNCAILLWLLRSWNAPSTFFDKLSFSKFGHVTILVAVSFKQTVGTSPLIFALGEIGHTFCLPPG